MVTLKNMLSQIACETARECGGDCFHEFANRVGIISPALGELARCFADFREGFPDYVLDWPEHLIGYVNEIAGLSPAGVQMWFEERYGVSKW